ncbi:hypothetical protein JTE90_005179 [Oedothorax gibbosus]|uniref:Uncharacterized protein n=1 Tax=Oedothorax gibbosus TaxID=931172 RepID=A0AAV6UIH9_9ARAC|nr:hypothetical protein JTE90_005179 [Oedothorax gibbosus]
MGAVWGFCYVIIALGITCVSGNDCNVSLVSPCYNSLVHYEGLGFPLYGQDDSELDDTCRNINDSFDCVNSFVGSCYNQPECDDECVEMITDIGLFSLNTGLKDLQSELCNLQSAMRETYLENYDCLERNADKYAACHNDSQKSQEYMDSMEDPKESLYARCCYLSWYQDCFTNITRDTCSVNATFFVSFSLHKLIGHISQHLCKDSPALCERPPLPIEDIDEEKPDVIDNDIDNSIEDSYNNSSRLGVSVFQLIYLFGHVIFTKHVFAIK